MEKDIKPSEAKVSEALLTLLKRINDRKPKTVKTFYELHEKELLSRAQTFLMGSGSLDYGTLAKDSFRRFWESERTFDCIEDAEIALFAKVAIAYRDYFKKSGKELEKGILLRQKEILTSKGGGGGLRAFLKDLGVQLVDEWRIQDAVSKRHFLLALNGGR